MLSRFDMGWNNWDEMFSTMNQLRNYMDRLFDEPSQGAPWSPRSSMPTFGGAWPRVNLVDNGNCLTMVTEVPGLSEKEVKLNLNQDVLTLSGERKSPVTEGYVVHRQERPTVQFSRSFALPCAVDPERTTATIKDGILTVNLEKAKEAQPRQITVKAS
jgi:HSP20 family protein